VLKSENDRLRSQVDRLSQDLSDARNRLNDLQSQYSSTSSKVEAYERAERDKQQAEARRGDFAALQAGIAGIASVKPSANGFTATLPDTFFVPNQTTLHVRVKSRMGSLASVISAHRDANFIIEGHSDARPNADGFAMARAQAVADYLAALGVSRSSFRVEARGANAPVSSKKTVAARPQTVGLSLCSSVRCERNAFEDTCHNSVVPFWLHSDRGQSTRNHRAVYRKSQEGNGER